MEWEFTDYKPQGVDSLRIETETLFISRLNTRVFPLHESKRESVDSKNIMTTYQDPVRVLGVTMLTGCMVKKSDTSRLSPCSNIHVDKSTDMSS